MAHNKPITSYLTSNSQNVLSTYKNTEAKNIEITNSIVNILAGNILTFTGLQSPEFRNLINTLDPR